MPFEFAGHELVAGRVIRICLATPDGLLAIGYVSRIIDNGKRRKLSLWEYAARRLLTTIARNDIAAKDLRDITRAFLELREWLDKDAARKPNVRQVLRLVGADAKL